MENIMTRQQIKNKVIEIIFNIYKNLGYDIGLIDKMDLIDDMGMDSVTYMYMVILIENSFDITFDDDVLLVDNFRNVDKIVSIICESVNLR